LSIETIELRQIKPVHLFTQYSEYYAALEEVKSDIWPLPFVWQAVKDVLKTFENFRDFVNTHNIENWVYDDGVTFSIRFRLSDFKKAVTQAGLTHHPQFLLQWGN